MPTPAKPMTPLRACQVANALIHRLDTYALIPATQLPPIYITADEIAALRTLHTTVARKLIGESERRASHHPNQPGYRTPGERRDGTLHIPKDR